VEDGQRSTTCRRRFGGSSPGWALDVAIVLAVTVLALALGAATLRRPDGLGEQVARRASDDELFPGGDDLDLEIPERAEAARDRVPDVGSVLVDSS